MSSGSESRAVIESSSSSSDSGDTNFFLNVQAFIEDTANSSEFRPRTSVDRQRGVGLGILLRDWFVEEPKYDEAFFRKKFRMDKSMFLEIVSNVEANFAYFQEGEDARGRKSFTALQKYTAAVRQLATGNPPDDYDEYLHMSARTGCDTLTHFCEAIIQLYGREYLRRPTQHDVARIFEAHETRHHIPGMLGSIDCTHVEWLNCPRKLRGQYTRGD